MSKDTKSKNKPPNEEQLQVALDNFAGIVKNLEYYENNIDSIIKLPIDVVMLATTGYYVSLGQLIKNKQGMDYRYIFKLYEKALEENKGYAVQNEMLKKNISVLKEWEKSLEYEMQHILELRDKYFAHIDFVDKGFFLKQIQNKDKNQQNDLVKFFRSMIVVSNDYSAAVIKAHTNNFK